MAERENYFIRVDGALVEVTREVYRTYHAMERHARTLEEKDTRWGTVLYSDLDKEGLLGVEMLPSRDAEPVEDAVIRRILSQELRHCVARLPVPDRRLIFALYFDGLSEREYARRLGISQKAVNKRRRRVLKKLRKMIKI